jgi:ABC-type branched-subunit amino acid transport system ATPase component
VLGVRAPQHTEAQQILLQAYQNSQIQDSKWNLVIIQGASGTGKTALVQSIREELQMTHGSMLRWPNDRQAGLHISPGFHHSLQMLIYIRIYRPARVFRPL